MIAPSEEITKDNFIDFGFSWLGINLTIYCTWGVHADQCKIVFSPRVKIYSCHDVADVYEMIDDWCIMINILKVILHNERFCKFCKDQV